MATFTTKLGLQKPDPLDLQDVDVLNDDFDTLDRVAGVIWVNDNVTPSDDDLFDGAIVRERSSGWAWTARSNGIGGFDKLNLAAPGYASLVTGAASPAIATSNAYANVGLLTTFSGHNQTKVATTSGSTLFVAQNGDYTITGVITWNGNSTGNRALRVMLNGAQMSYDKVELANSNSPHTVIVHLGARALNAGDALTLQSWQNSGASLVINRAEISLGCMSVGVMQ